MVTSHTARTAGSSVGISHGYCYRRPLPGMQVMALWLARYVASRQRPTTGPGVAMMEGIILIINPALRWHGLMGQDVWKGH